MQGYGGLACEMPDELACLADCSGRGTCVRGFCHCQPGYYGTGCLKEVSAQAAQQQEQQGQQEQGQEQQEGELGSRTHLKIYMYDLPWQVAFQDGYSPSEFIRGVAVQSLLQCLDPLGQRDG
jgi:hypothetical protein